uniref:Deoxyribose-phosphate aldolase n=1 Tax=Scophthalmus maximus TaxID=52904 RepID=A0A8D3BCB9_SCOMX
LMGLNTQAVLKRAQQIQGHKLLKKQWQAAWLLKAVTCIDLTTLAGDDTPSNVHRLCLKAIQPIRHDLLRKLDMNDKGVTTAAVCVYPSRVADAVTSLKAANSSLPVASVATGFPAGQTPLETRLQEVRMAVSDGATEIDIVINRTAPMYDEIRQFREACGDAHMKTILAIGELGTFTNVYKASMVAMMAGSDFIKTSTGKESVNATYPVAIVMVRAIRDYFLCTGHKVGFKPAGGIRTAQESLVWLSLIKEELGNDWLCPQMFRLGASSLLADIERQSQLVTEGNWALWNSLPFEPLFKSLHKTTF